MRERGGAEVLYRMGCNGGGKLPGMAGTLTPARYGVYLIVIAGFGGLLYGIDVGIIAAALLYLGKTVSLSVAQTSVIVAAVLGGSMASSLVAGLLADWLGRKRMMILSGLLFVASVGLIALSQGFAMLLVGRLLQGVSGGVIAVVVPLYLAECLPAANRGRGTAIFQLMLTVGIVVAAVAGWYYTQGAEHAIAAAGSDAGLIRAAEDHAWRGMFLSVVYPGLIFFAGSFFVTETPRWLFRKGRAEEARVALLRLLAPHDAELQMREMEAVKLDEGRAVEKGERGSLLQRRYVIPFALACVVLACNQATGINSILGFLVIILKQAGMSASRATEGDVAVKVLNCVMTVVAVALVDRKGRRFLLRIGTGGIVVSLLMGALLFHGFEAKRVEMREALEARVSAGGLEVPLEEIRPGGEAGRPMALTVLYTFGAGDRVLTVLTSDRDAVVRIGPEVGGAPIRIKHAFFGPVPTERTGWLITGCLAMFIAFFSIGPGVVVWLMLSELMPTRIRSTGMGIALLLNQGVSTAIAGVFLPIVGNFGYQAMFSFWAGCTVIYFVTATFFLPETKGRTLEEIEEGFAGARAGRLIR